MLKRAEAKGSPHSPQFTPPRFIAVEGPIRVGKSTLARFLAEKMHARRLLDCEDNPFLADFYREKQGAAFPAQMYFLSDRHQRLREAQSVELPSPLVADFLFEKDKLFAYLNLDNEELKLYERYYERFAAELRPPDLVIYLQATPEVLRERVGRKAAPHESRISHRYIEAVARAYEHFFFRYAASDLLVVNTSEIDFVNRQEDLEQLLRRIGEPVKGTQYYLPLGAESLTSMDRAEVVIIGGGVVGCAVARELSARLADVFVLEQLPRLGMATSTRNSGVVHSGIYYPPGSLKARLCVAGNRLTKEFCAAHGVPHENCGKLVVAAQEAEIPALERLAANGRANGVKGLRVIGRREIREREPHVEAAAALEVPSTGILSSEELVKAYARVAAQQGAILLTGARVTALEARTDSVLVRIARGDPARQDSDSEEVVEARIVVNAAGLYADEVAALAGNRSYRIYPVRGEYAEVRGTHADLVRALVYPLPRADHLSLGVHLTRTLWGTLLVGPTADYIADKTDYERNRLPLEEFFRDAQPLLPELKLEDLQLAYSGIRPKLVPPRSAAFADFVITRDPKWPRIIHLVGIESPGLTSAPAIAREVESLIAGLM